MTDPTGLLLKVVLVFQLLVERLQDRVVRVFLLQKPVITPFSLEYSMDLEILRLIQEARIVYEFTVDINCDLVSDNTGNDFSGASHPDNDGVNDACLKSVLAFANTLDVETEPFDFDTTTAGTVTLAAVKSNTVSIPLDHDGDGILNSDEGNTDSDADGVKDYLDSDSDDNGISDMTEGAGSPPTDTDGDGKFDYKDLDDDGDGVTDTTEINLGNNTLDSDGDGLFDYQDPDSDNDGIADASEDVITAQTNTDGEDGANYLDLDSDNDGIPDFIENGLSSCDNGAGAGIASNGLLEPDETAACNVASVCTSSPCDANGNGAIELSELIGGALPDQDGDGTPNFLDLDSDNDGISDLYEAFLGPATAGWDKLVGFRNDSRCGFICASCFSHWLRF